MEAGASCVVGHLEPCVGQRGQELDSAGIGCAHVRRGDDAQPRLRPAGEAPQLLLQHPDPAPFDEGAEDVHPVRGHELLPELRDETGVNTGARQEAADRNRGLRSLRGSLAEHRLMPEDSQQPLRLLADRRAGRYGIRTRRQERDDAVAHLDLTVHAVGAVDARQRLPDELSQVLPQRGMAFPLVEWCGVGPEGLPQRPKGLAEGGVNHSLVEAGGEWASIVLMPHNGYTSPLLPSPAVSSYWSSAPTSKLLMRPGRKQPSQPNHPPPRCTIPCLFCNPHVSPAACGAVASP